MTAAVGRAGSFAVTENDRASHRAGLPDVLFSGIVGCALLGVATWLVAGDGRSTLSTAAGFVAVVAGAALLIAAVWAARRRLDRVEVTADGVGFHSGRSRARWFRWHGEAWQIRVYDYRKREPAGRLWYRVPCVVSARGVGGGVSGEAADAIESAARKARLEVVVREGRIVRTVRIRADPPRAVGVGVETPRTDGGRTSRSSAELGG